MTERGLGCPPELICCPVFAMHLDLSIIVLRSFSIVVMIVDPVEKFSPFCLTIMRPTG